MTDTVSVFEFVFSFSTSVVFIMTLIMVSTLVSDMRFAKDHGVNGVFLAYVKSMIAFMSAIAYLYVAFLVYSVITLIHPNFQSDDVRRTVILSTLLSAQIVLSIVSVLYNVTRYKVGIDGVAMRKRVVVAAKPVWKSKSVWLGVLTIAVFVSEYVSFNMNMLGLSDSESLLLMFVTGLIGGVATAITRLYTSSPVDGSPAHAKSARSDDNG